MEFKTKSGVFDTPSGENGQSAFPAFPRRKLPAAPQDIAGVSLLAVEVLLLLLFAKPLFYGFVLPLIGLLLDISGFLAALLVIAAVGCAVLRRIFRRHRRWF